jgi:hypothetical protein
MVVALELNFAVWLMIICAALEVHRLAEFLN